MFLSKLFKHARAKAMVVLAGFAMILGAGAAISVGISQQENEVVETKAIDDKYYLAGNKWNNWSATGQKMTRSSDSSACAYVVTFAANDQFKVTDGTWDHSWGSEKLDDATFGSFEAAGGNIKCKTEGTYTIVWDGSKIHTHSGDLSFQSGKVGWVVALNTSGGNTFTVADSVKMDNGTGDNAAQKTGISVPYGTHFQVAYSNGYGFNTDGWKTGNAVTGITKSSEDTDQFVVTNGGTIDVYLNGTTYVVYPTFTIATYTISFAVAAGSSGYGTVSGSSITNVEDGTTVTVSNNTVTIGGITITATPAATTASYKYSFREWSNVSNGEVIRGAKTISANFNREARVYKNLTYKYLDVDGVTVDDADTESTEVGTTVTLPTPSVSGYRFVSWYASDGFSGTVYDAGDTFTMPNSATTFTAKFERIGFYLVTNDNGYTANASSYGSESSGTWTWSGVSLDADDMLKVRYIGSAHSYEDSGWLGYNRLSSSSLAYDNFTQVIGGGNNNNIKATEGGTFEIRLVEGATDGATAIYIDWTPAFTQGYYVVGDETFGGTPEWSVESGVMLSETPTGTDQAKGIHIAIPAGAEFAITKYVDGHNDEWFNSWGDYPSSCEVVTGDAGADNLHYTGSDTAYFDIYVNASGVIYIVDDAVIDAAGYIYFASDLAKGSIELTVTNENDQTTIDGYLSAVSTVQTDKNISEFAGQDNLYKIPFYNLRGTFVTAKIKTISIDGGDPITVSSFAQNDSKNYYMTSTGISEAKGAAAAAVFALDAAMYGKSICDDSMSSQLSGLKSSIEAGYTGDSTLMSGAKILTCASGGDRKTFTTEWPVSEIYKQICRLLKTTSSIGAWPLSAFSIPGAPAGTESPLTMTLWIVLGCGVAGLGAIGAAYFVSKKKKRYQA